MEKVKAVIPMNVFEFTILLDGFFRDATKPIYLYCRERGGEWIAVVGSSRDPDRDGGKTYNRSWYYGDLSEVSLKNGRMQGRFTLHMTPDLWVPKDHRPYTIEFEIDASVQNEILEGQWLDWVCGQGFVIHRSSVPSARVSAVLHGKEEILNAEQDGVCSDGAWILMGKSPVGVHAHPHTPVYRPGT